MIPSRRLWTGGRFGADVLAHAAWSLGATWALVGAHARAGDFADRVIEYRPAPGQFVNNAGINDPTRALGPPVGGGAFDSDNSKVVTLGGFAGSITLGFDQPIRDDARNPLGMDFIVYSNAFWFAGDPTLRFAEPAVVEVSFDANANGLPDDAWFLIPGSSLPSPAPALETQMWDDNPGTPTPPADPAIWYPSIAVLPGVGSTYSTTGWSLPAELAAGTPPFVVANPGGAGATVEAHWGYAELSPTLLLGDYSGASGDIGDDRLDDPEDRPGVDPAVFYSSRPDDPFSVGVDPGSAGGDAFDIAWAVDPATGAPAGLSEVHFVRISSGSTALRGPLGEVSPEIDAVADVRALGDLNGDDVVNAGDLATLLGAWGSNDPRADLNLDGVVNAADLATLLGAWG